MQLTQDVIGQMARGFGFAIYIDRDVGIFAAHFLNEVAQIHHRGVKVRPGRKFFVVDRQNKRTGA